jgi:hypothetical protein
LISAGLNCVKAARSSLLAVGAELLSDMMVVVVMVMVRYLVCFCRPSSLRTIWMLHYDGEGKRYPIYHRFERLPACTSRGHGRLHDQPKCWAICALRNACKPAVPWTSYCLAKILLYVLSKERYLFSSSKSSGAAQPR